MEAGLYEQLNKKDNSMVTKFVESVASSKEADYERPVFRRDYRSFKAGIDST